MSATDDLDFIEHQSAAEETARLIFTSCRAGECCIDPYSFHFRVPFEHQHEKKHGVCLCEQYRNEKIKIEFEGG